MHACFLFLYSRQLRSFEADRLIFSFSYTITMLVGIMFLGDALQGQQLQWLETVILWILSYISIHKTWTQVLDMVFLQHSTNMRLLLTDVSN